jgi:dTDP-4-dehydrorhamnose reductase
LKKTILIVGADGMIGKSLFVTFQQEGKSVLGSTRNKVNAGEQKFYLDLDESEDPCLLSLPMTMINTVIFCAAITSIKRCHLEPVSTRRINVVNTVSLAKKFIDAGIFTVFLSSNLVFDGRTAYAKPNDQKNPQTEYGRQKAETEEILLSLGQKVSVVRFSKVFSRDTPLLKGWASDMIAGKTIHPLSDGFMAPISDTFAIDVLKRVITHQISGITQASARDDISYEYAARYIAEKLSIDTKLIEPITSDSFGIQDLPKHTTLNSSRLYDLGLDIPLPTQALDQLNLA